MMEFHNLLSANYDSVHLAGECAAMLHSLMFETLNILILTRVCDSKCIFHLSFFLDIAKILFLVQRNK